jgi:hypothetical protein
MAGDLRVHERAVLEDVPQPQGAAGAQQVPGRVIHRFGWVSILAEPDEAAGQPVPGAVDLTKVPPGLNKVERAGIDALLLRESDAYRHAKKYRPRDGETWDMPDCSAAGAHAATDAGPPTGTAAGGAPTSAYLEGSVAVGIIIVSGPTDNLKFSDYEQTKIVAEVQDGLGWYATTFPLAGISFTYDIQHVTITTPSDPATTDPEGIWRNPAMSALGYTADKSGVWSYIEDIRGRFGTRWTYCGFFTKYPVYSAYANLGGPHLVVNYANNGYGPDNIDRTFAHETGHIFGAYDEYGSCGCAGRVGRFGVANGNCEACSPPGGGVACIMKHNTFAHCEYTPGQLGLSVVTPLFAHHSGKVLDVKDGFLDNGVPVIQWDWSGRDNQRWRLEAVGDGYVRAVALHSGKVLDVPGMSTDSGAQVHQWDWWGGDNQLWLFDRVADGVYRLVAKHSGKVLDVSGGSQDNGASVIQWDWSGADHQRWEYQYQPLFAKHSGKALAVAGASRDNGAAAIQWDWWGGDEQRWRVEPVDGGYVRITARHTGKVLDVKDGSVDNGAPLIQWDWTGVDNQRFTLEPVEDGHFRLVAKHSGKVLDVWGGSPDSGAQITQWDWYDGDNQKWRY